MVSYGHDRKRPHTEITLNASGLGSANARSEKPLVLIGSATGGQPKVPVELTNFAQAREFFRGGELLDAIEMAWNPSPNTRGAGKIFAIRADDAKQGSKTSGGLTVTSKLYGADANEIQYSLEDNTLTNSKRFKVYFTKERYEQVYDNIGNIFSIKYKGTQAYASVEVKVDATSKLATQLILKAGADVNGATVLRTYTLGTGVYQNVNVLINDISNLPDFEVVTNSLGGNKNVETQFLDALAVTEIKAGAKMITAIGADLVNQTETDPYVKVTYDPKTAIPATIPVTNLAGGSTTAPGESWATMFSAVADLGAYYIVPLTDKEAIHGELSQFLRDESGAGNQLRGFVGGGLKETFDKLKARQAGLRNPRVSLVGNSGTRRMSDGRVYNYPAYMGAALIGGIASGIGVGEPVTYKKLNVEALDMKFTGDQLDQLDGAGVVMVEFVRTRQSSYFRIVSDPTTYNASTEPVQNRVSLGEVSDFLTTELRTMLDEQFIGTRIRNTSASIIKNAVESFLDQQKNVDGLIVDYNPDDVQVVITGNSARINITVQPARGLDDITVGINYVDNKLTA
ncbi:tail sheath [Bacillus phage JBP901]|uniref:Tail sheath protein n=2 Tax=Caeruleovirus TaxID=1911929 RepID=A0A0E3D9A1_9CAUD|nr:tail sheath [Bacillus phage JBP901]YP_009149574.1 tail sheath [Bacillus phage BCP8-2]AHJ87051.1 tail sheath protein [Bacillus phage BCP8-2]AID17899.1 putative tail sheath protein [Bacillus phage JBP901]